jgi:hypothetical protein
VQLTPIPLYRHRLSGDLYVFLRFADEAPELPATGVLPPESNSLVVLLHLRSGRLLVVRLSEIHAQRPGGFDYLEGGEPCHDPS